MLRFRWSPAGPSRRFRSWPPFTTVLLVASHLLVSKAPFDNKGTLIVQNITHAPQTPRSRLDSSHKSCATESFTHHCHPTPHLERGRQVSFQPTTVQIDHLPSIRTFCPCRGWVCSKVPAPEVFTPQSQVDTEPSALLRGPRYWRA
jgi:hypothetical protein